ncbi:MAG: AAA family ATPase [Lachnospirales bacterium]
MCNVISVSLNYEGIGKSTCTRNLASSLAMLNKNVLVIDLDPKAGLTTYFGVSEIKKLSIYNVLKNNIEHKDMRVEDFILEIDNVHFIPANNELNNLNFELNEIENKDFVLKEFINKYREKYDYILIDCMSIDSMLTVNALNASDSVILPITINFDAIKAVENMIENIKIIQKTTNANLKIEGLLFFKHNFDLKIPRHIKMVIYKAHKEEVTFFKTKVVESSKVIEANNCGMSVIEYRKNSRIATNFLDIASEIGKSKNAFFDDEDLEYFKMELEQEDAYNSEEKDDILTLPVENLLPYNGRTFESFKNEKFDSLVISIKEKGLENPILVHKTSNDFYEILSGHNRVEAFKFLGFKEIKAVLLDVNKQDEVDFIAELVNSNIK